MPQPNEGGSEETPKEPTEDNFGVKIDSEGSDVPQGGTTEEGEGKKGDGKKEEIEKTPEVIALEVKLEEYGKNLSNQGQVIADLKAKIKVESEKKGETKEGDEAEADVMFKDIKTSKDLSDEEKENMTEAEIAMFDRNAGLETAMNKMFETMQKRQKQTEEAKVEDLNSSAQVEAGELADEAIKANPELAKDATELKDKIIVEFNEYNNEGITPDILKARMKKALNNLEGYTPPKEQEEKGGSKAGGAVKKSGDGKTDEFGIDKVVSSVKKSNDGNYDF